MYGFGYKYNKKHWIIQETTMKFWQTLVIIVIFSALAFVSGRLSVKRDSDNNTTTTVVVVHDTLRIKEPVYVASKPVHDSVVVAIHDTTYVVRADTLYLPKEQKEYRDSTYHAWVSGVSPSLDSIYVYQKTKIIKETISVPVVKKQRLNLGVQAGVGAIQPFSEQFSPKVGYYLGLGIQYNF